MKHLSEKKRLLVTLVSFICLGFLYSNLAVAGKITPKLEEQFKSKFCQIILALAYLGEPQMTSSKCWLQDEDAGELTFGIEIGLKGIFTGKAYNLEGKMEITKDKARVIWTDWETNDKPKNLRFARCKAPYFDGKSKELRNIIPSLLPSALLWCAYPDCPPFTSGRCRLLKNSSKHLTFAIEMNYKGSFTGKSHTTEGYMDITESTTEIMWTDWTTWNKPWSWILSKTKMRKTKSRKR